MNPREEQDPSLLVVERVYEALDADDPGRALALAREALRDSVEADPVIRFLAGVALMELDRPRDAVAELRIAAQDDPDDTEVAGTLARALFRSGEFVESHKLAAAALKADANLPDAHFVLGLNLERQGRLNDADDHFKNAARLDPDRFPAPIRSTREAFGRQLSRAIDRLPAKYRRHLEQVAVTVEDLPSDEIIEDCGPELDAEQLLGLFVGVSLDRQSSLSPGDLPARILLFQRNLERMALDAEDLEEEIAITLYHELGHYLGLTEDELEQIDLA